MTDETKKEPYIFTGPDGELVNRHIEADRQAMAPMVSERSLVPTIKPVAGLSSNEILKSVSEAKITGPHSAREVVKALGVLEARNHEGRNC